MRTALPGWKAAERVSVDQVRVVRAALVELASDEVVRDPRFANRERLLYDALTPAKKTAKAGAGRPKLLPTDIEPIKHIEGRPFDIGAPPDPYFLLEVFGAAQLPRVLALYSKDGLLQAVELVQERHTTAKPKGKTKPALVDFLVREVSARP